MLEKLVVSLEKKVAHFEISFKKKEDEHEKGKQIEGKEVIEEQSLDEIIRENSLNSNVTIVTSSSDEWVWVLAIKTGSRLSES